MNKDILLAIFFALGCIFFLTFIWYLMKKARIELELEKENRRRDKNMEALGRRVR